MNGGNGREHADREALRERLSAYLDGELAPADAAALERHLAECAECRDELAALREVRTLLRALPPPALPRSFALPPTAAPHSARPPATWPLPDRPPRAVPAHRPGTTSARPPAAALARAAQWAGSLAAAIGLLLIVATAVLGANPGAPRTFGTTAASGAHVPQRSGTTPLPSGTATPYQSPTRPGIVQGGPGTPTPTAEPSPTSTSGQVAAPTNPAASSTPTTAPPAAASSSEAFPVLPVAGAGLLTGGVVLFGAGSVAARRRSRRGR